MPMPNDEYDDQVEQDAPDWFAQYLPDTQPISVAPGFTESPGGGYGAESNLDEATRTGRDTAPPSAFPGRFGDDGYDPYAISLGDKFDPRSPEGRASSLMESAIGQTRGRIESASQLNQDRVIDWNRVEIDQDERGAPVQKVYSTTGKLLGVSEPVGSFDDLRSVGGYAKDPEGNRYDLPGFEAVPPTQIEIELVWGVNSRIFYFGVRKYIYGMPVPENLNELIEAEVKTFFDGIGTTLKDIVRGRTVVKHVRPRRAVGRR